MIPPTPRRQLPWPPPLGRTAVPHSTPAPRPVPVPVPALARGPAVAPVLALGVTLALAACGGPPPAPPPVPAEVAGSPCPLPLAFARDEPRPRYVRIENATEQELEVYLDRCFWLSRMAKVPPGSWRQARLPGSLVTYRDALWFHAFGGDERWTAYSIDVHPEPVLRLVLSPRDSAAQEERPRWNPLPEGVDRRRGPPLIADTDRGFVSVWGVGGGGVLTWACRGDEGPWLSLTLDRSTRSEEPPAVEVEIDGEWRDAGRWSVLESVTDALVAPLDVAARLSRDLPDTDLVRINVDEGRRRSTVYAFEVQEVPPVLATLPCWPG